MYSDYVYINWYLYIFDCDMDDLMNQWRRVFHVDDSIIIFVRCLSLERLVSLKICLLIKSLPLEDGKQKFLLPLQKLWREDFFGNSLLLTPVVTL